MIAGIDFSTRAVDVVLLDEDTDAAEWYRFQLAGNDAFDRARSVRGARMVEGAATFPGGMFWDDVLAVGIEDPRGYGAGSLYRVQGAILSCIPAEKLVQPWIPSAWRKTVGLPGNATKEQVAAFALDKWTWPTAGTIPPDPTQDCLDAYCIALATRSLIQVGAAA